MNSVPVENDPQPPHLSPKPFPDSKNFRYIYRRQIYFVCCEKYRFLLVGTWTTRPGRKTVKIEFTAAQRRFFAGVIFTVFRILRRNVAAGEG